MASPPSPDYTGFKPNRGIALLRIVSVIPRRRTYVTLLFLVLAGAAEGFGVASLLPLIGAVGAEGGQPKGVARHIVDAVHAVGLEPTLGLFVSLLVVGMLLKAVLTLIAMSRVGSSTADVVMKVRMDLMRALIGAKWSYYARQPVGRFSAAIANEAHQAGEAYSSAAKFAAEAIQVITYVVIAMLFSWQVGLLSIGVGLIMVLTLNRFLSTAKKTAYKQRKHARTMLSSLLDLLIGIKPMKAMGRHARFETLFEKDAEKIRLAQRKQVFARDANKALQEPILAACLAVGIYGAVGVYAIPTAELVVMTLLLARIVMTIGKAQQALQAVNIAQSGFIAITETTEFARANREVERGGRAPNFERAVEFRDVTFGFGGGSPEVIRGASFTVEAGKLTTITGTSGAGKTTLVDLLLGLHEPTGGDILIDGVSLSDIAIDKWRNMIGYVPQEQILFHDSLRANITIGQPEFTDADVTRAVDDAGASRFVAELPQGVETLVGERGAMLSGGQRQRVAIARALIHKPRLLVFDEATTALDPETEAEIVENVKEIVRRTGVTVIAISHQPAWAAASDLVVHLARGQIVKVDRAEDEPAAHAPRASLADAS